MRRVNNKEFEKWYEEIQRLCKQINLYVPSKSSKAIVLIWSGNYSPSQVADLLKSLEEDKY
jgi:hypothetical protein